MAADVGSILRGLGNAKHIEQERAKGQLEIL